MLVVAAAVFQHDLLEVVEQQLVGVATEVLEGVEVALDQRLGPRVERVLDVAHPAVAQNQDEEVEAAFLAVEEYAAEVGPVDLPLPPWLRLEACNGKHAVLVLDACNVVLDDGVAARVALAADFFQEAFGAQVVLGEAAVDVGLVGVEDAGLGGSRRVDGRSFRGQGAAHGSPVEAEFSGDGAGRHALSFQVVYVHPGHFLDHGRVLAGWATTAQA